MADDIQTTPDAALNPQGKEAAQNVETPAVEPTIQKVEGEEPQPVVNFELELQQERSRSGRRISAMERDLKEKLNKIDAIEASLERLQTTLQGRNTSEEEDDAFIQKKELPNLLEQEQQKQEATKQKRQQQFLDGLINVSIEDGDTEEEFAEVKKEINENYNTLITGDPRAFGESLYNKVKKSMLKKKLAELQTGKKTPLKNEKPKAPLGGGQSSVIPSQKRTMPKLEPAVEEYARSQGLTPEEIEEALTGPMNIRIIK